MDRNYLSDLFKSESQYLQNDAMRNQYDKLQKKFR